MAHRSAPRPLPDRLRRGLLVVFCGINPSLASAEAGHHYARPGNRFWRALHEGGWTRRRFSPEEDHLLPDLGIGLTNLVARPTRSAADLEREELERGARRLAAKLLRYRPRALCVLGIGAFERAFGRKVRRLGLQEIVVGGTPTHVLPNPSGLNAHYPPAELARLFARLRRGIR